MDRQRRNELRSFTAGLSTEQRECRISRHQRPSITRLGKDPHVVMEFDEKTRTWDVIAYCMRDCGVHWRAHRLRAGVLDAFGSPQYPHGYLSDIGRIDAGDREVIRNDLFAEADEDAAMATARRAMRLQVVEGVQTA